MNKEEIEEIETLEIDFKDTYELELALEVSSKKAIYLIDDLIKHLFELQQENAKYKEVIEKIELYQDTIKSQKEVIDKIKHYIEKECRIYGLSMPIDVATHLDNILGILKEVE